MSGPFFARISRLILLVFLMVLVPAITRNPHQVFGDTTSHSPILINGNNEFTQDNGVTGGSGTSDDPYIISGWAIGSNSNQPGCDTGIMIANTTAHFTISGVSIFDSCPNGIVLSQIENGVVQDSQITVFQKGVNVDTSNNFQITGNSIEAGSTVLTLYNSDSFDVSNNNLQGGSFTLVGHYLSDASIVGNTGGAEDGILLDNFSGLLISQNNIRAHVSLSVASCGNLIVDSNTFPAFDIAIFVSDCSNVQVSNNMASSAADGRGIWVRQSTSIAITSNNVTYNEDGIRLQDNATGNTVTNNSISHNNCGIRTDSTSNPNQNNFAENTFTGNAQDYCFSDDFLYGSISDMVAAGWTQCGDSSSSYYSVGNSVLTVINDGFRAGDMCWSNVPSGTSNWTVTVKEAATGGTYASLPLIVNTAHHQYYFLADGYTYYLRFALARDGQDVGITATGSYNAQFNVYHTIQMTMSNNVLNVYFDNTLIFTYTEPDSGTSFTSVQLFANWEATDSYDWITITSP